MKKMPAGMPTADNYYDLAAAIVRQACTDYKSLVYQLLKNKASGDADKRGYILGQIKAIRKDFRSDWFCLLGVNDAAFFIREMNLEVRKKREPIIEKTKARQKGSF